MLEQIKNGSNSLVINISSVSARDPRKDQSIYGASKSALSYFSEVLRRELNPVDVRVTTIEPDATDMNAG